jgi:hypothetical protein
MMSGMHCAWTLLSLLSQPLEPLLEAHRARTVAAAVTFLRDLGTGYANGKRPNYEKTVAREGTLGGCSMSERIARGHPLGVLPR